MVVSCAAVGSANFGEPALCRPTGSVPEVSASVNLLHELVSEAAALTPDRPAVVMPDGPSATFAEFDERVRGTAGWLRARTAPGDRVAVVADNSLDYAVLYYAAPWPCSPAAPPVRRKVLCIPIVRCWRRCAGR